MTSIHPVILCGGHGTRLWPRSRKNRPKPFLPLLGSRSLFQRTLDRCTAPGPFAPPIIVAGADHVALIEGQWGDHGEEARIVVEPEGRNTAPAIALAAALLPPEAIMLVCPSDHHIADANAFRDAAATAAQLAGEDYLVAFGIEPTAPETGYGYIQQGEAVPGGYTVKRFVEKPDAALAEAFIVDGGFSWNGGIFAFRAGHLLDELRDLRPGMASLAQQAAAGARREDHLILPDADAFKAITGESIDYAVMENTQRAAMVPVSMGWSDIGNWRALHEARPHDDAGNSVSGPAKLVDCHNVAIDSDGTDVTVQGCENIVVVVDNGRVLITAMDRAQDVGKLAGSDTDLPSR
ncbi:Mannose-1-phosphate guanylyltransferase [Alteripontixanthobacter maritimus]|uniref:Mannose-1-phosphate guanylyltransferase n=1 Tax=Alteripontixanthobacter maritimus TaxID=2161824 RepID=A0A369QAR4_9SPHN|nr:mannose-1-phosphate guanylyltransferase [Alteripontixanthobacter maritimus]RDC60625.1 Mannose-1-phosphate guanylyltransferase [Alteripontixanthobacter maritimus]